MDDMLGGTRNGKTRNDGNGLSQASMTAMISAGSSIKQAKAQAATSSQLSALADASIMMEEAVKADGKTEKTDDKDAKTAGAKENGSDENVSGIDTQKRKCI